VEGADPGADDRGVRVGIATGADRFDQGTRVGAEADDERRKPDRVHDEAGRTERVGRLLDRGPDAREPPRRFDGDADRSIADAAHRFPDERVAIAGAVGSADGPRGEIRDVARAPTALMSVCVTRTMASAALARSGAPASK
jgi:hypothetical protein